MKNILRASSHIAITFTIMAFIALSLGFAAPAFAQSPQHEGFRAGAALNLGTIHFEDDVDYLNDLYSAATGLELHALYAKKLNPAFSVETGFTLFSHRYDLRSEQDITDETGTPTGGIIITETKESVGTSYLSVPLSLIAHPFSQTSALSGLYFTLGPEVGYKVAHVNGSLQTRAYDETGDEIVEFRLDDQPFEDPERSRDLVFFAHAGIGYDLNSQRLPLTIELRGKHSINTYFDQENSVDSWIRKVSFMISYRL